MHARLGSQGYVEVHDTIVEDEVKSSKSKRIVKQEDNSTLITQSGLAIKIIETL